MDATVVGLLQTMIITGSKDSQILSNNISQNLMQALGVVLATCVQAAAGVNDDPALIAALQTAATAPKQGAVGGN